MIYRIMDLHIFDGENGNTQAGGSAQQNRSTGYTFEQAEEIANSRAEKASRAALADFYRKQGLNEAEITTAIADFKAKQSANKPNISAIEKERDDARAELEQMKNSNVLRDKGVKTEDLDYVMFKVSKMVDDKTDFTKAAEKFLKENPRFTSIATGYRVSTSTETNSNGNAGNINATINGAIRAALRR